MLAARTSAARASQWGYMATSDAGNTVSYNLLHDVFQGELSDGGCVYNLGRSPGTVIDHNVCHSSSAYGYGGWGLYTDEGSSNVTVSNNVVFATKDASFHQHCAWRRVCVLVRVCVRGGVGGRTESGVPRASLLQCRCADGAQQPQCAV